MIKNKQPLSMAESREFIDSDTDKGKEMIGFIKKFIKLKPKKAKELRKKLQKMEMIKLKDKHISKIIDLLPETSEDLNKVFNDVGLNEDETKKILDTIKEYR